VGPRHAGAMHKVAPDKLTAHMAHIACKTAAGSREYEWWVHGRQSTKLHHASSAHMISITCRTGTNSHKQQWVHDRPGKKLYQTG
jgi:hypothetical protein